MANRDPNTEGLRPIKKGERRGRKPGKPNKTTRILKDALLMAAELEGDYHYRKRQIQENDGLVGFLRWAARKELPSFLSLLGRVLPMQVKMNTEQAVVYRSLEEIQHDIDELNVPLERLAPLLLGRAPLEGGQRHQQGEHQRRSARWQRQCLLTLTHLTERVMDKRHSACPAPECSAVNPLQQEAAQQLTASGVEGDWVRNGRRCSACGCVYILNGVTKVIKGRLDSDTLGPGWKSGV
jgi:hypothetical protein